MFIKSPIHIATVLVLGVFAFSGAAFAHFAQGQKVVESKSTTQPKVKSVTTENTAVETPALAPTQSEPCSKTVTETNDTSGSNATNIKRTEVHCQSSTESGSTSVDISNDSSQSATTGDSTGQSGTASNNDTTDINVN